MKEGTKVKNRENFQKLYTALYISITILHLSQNLGHSSYLMAFNSL